jgi:tRNA threonylcarbamoyladenosine biosynthesis protein TsaB
MSAWLAIDTASDTASVALDDGAAVLSELSWLGRRRHTVALAPRVAQVLADADMGVHQLDGIAVAIGPGSYTGLRIGLALAKGLALAGDVPLVGIPTLDILAASLSPPSVPRDVPLWAIFRAGREQMVAACYPPAGPWPAADRLSALTLDELLATAVAPAWVAGELTGPERAALAASGLTVLPPEASLRRAAWLCALGRARWAAGGVTDPAALVPLYLGAVTP